MSHGGERGQHGDGGARQRRGEAVVAFPHRGRACRLGRCYYDTIVVIVAGAGDVGWGGVSFQKVLPTEEGTAAVSPPDEEGDDRNAKQAKEGAQRDAYDVNVCR